MKFLTEEWCEEFFALAKDTFSPEKTPSKATLTLCECYSNVPQFGGDLVWMLYTFKNGVLTDTKRGTGRSSVPKADYITDADYDFCVQSLTGPVNLLKALTGGKVKLKGNLLRATKLIDTHSYLDKCKLLNGKTEW